ncbi:MAG TPA: TraR/DksA C4-type zinc finger protein [Trebonia sp.]|jgi:DnaK suppressor protein|nr:TraR/DksA C4-type zinc finger protein [Trebonia sp.]
MHTGGPDPVRSRLNTDRERALQRIADLDREFAAIVASASEGSAGGDDEHDPEGATVAYERQHIAALRAQAREQLDMIDAALRKVASGIYEICDICGEPIGAERLAARPASLICIRCAAKRR